MVSSELGTPIGPLPREETKCAFVLIATKRVIWITSAPRQAFSADEDALFSLAHEEVHPPRMLQYRHVESRLVMRGVLM